MEDCVTGSEPSEGRHTPTTTSKQELESVTIPPVIESVCIEKTSKMESTKLLASDSDSLASSTSGTSLEDDPLVTSSTHLLCPTTSSHKKVSILAVPSVVPGRPRSKTRDTPVVIDIVSSDEHDHLSKMTPYLDCPHPFAVPHADDCEMLDNSIIVSRGTTVSTAGPPIAQASSSASSPPCTTQPHLHPPSQNCCSSVGRNVTTTITSSNRPLRMSSCVSVQSALSTSSSDSSLSEYPPDTPICKFCHQRAKAHDQLISPCYCKGSIRHMHCSCLMKWLEKLKKRNSRHQPLCCEICNYEYRWKKKFKSLKDWRLPPCTGNDRKWHLIFLLCALVMIISMMNLIIFGEDDTRGSRDKTHRTPGAPTTNSLGTFRFSNSKPVNVPGGGGGNNTGDETGNTRNLSNPITLVLHSVNGSQLAGSTAWHNFTNLTVGNLTLLLGNLTFPPLHQLMLPIERQSNQTGSRYAHPHVIRIGPAGSMGNGYEHRPLHVGHHHHHHHHRRNYPTKPSEVILVISGCLFFITFFLGTFAQIKSEVSFYTMIIKFVHYNQQWIIEEYNPDDMEQHEDIETATSSSSPAIASTPSDAGHVVVVHETPAETIDTVNNNTSSSNLQNIEAIETKQVIEL